MSCCRFSRSFPLFSIFYSSLVSCLIVVLLPPGDRRQSCRLICGSPSDLPLYRFFLRTSDCLLCGQDQLNHIPRIPPQSLLPVSQLGVFWTSYLIFQKILTIGTINRGVPCPTQLFFFFRLANHQPLNTMEWQPQQEPLRQLACYLRNSLDGYNRTAQKEAEQVSVSFYFHHRRMHASCPRLILILTCFLEGL